MERYARLTYQNYMFYVFSPILAMLQWYNGGIGVSDWTSEILQPRELCADAWLFLSVLRDRLQLLLHRLQLLLHKYIYTVFNNYLSPLIHDSYSLTLTSTILVLEESVSAVSKVCLVYVFLPFRSILFWYKFLYVTHISLVTRKPVFGVSDQLRLKSACSATETS